MSKYEAWQILKQHGFRRDGSRGKDVLCFTRSAKPFWYAEIYLWPSGEFDYMWLVGNQLVDSQLFPGGKRVDEKDELTNYLKPIDA